MTLLTADHLLSHWTQSPKNSERLDRLTGEMLEVMRQLSIGNEEALILDKLLARNQSDLVYRYLDLQLFYQLSEDDEAKHLSIELKKDLFNHFKNPEDKTFSQTLALRSMENILGNFLVKLGGSPKAPKRDLTVSHFGSYMKGCIGSALKETSSQILEPFADEAEETLEYWNRLCVQLEQLNLWEETIDQLTEEVEEMGARAGSEEDLQTRCEHFEIHLGQLSISIRQLLDETLLSGLPKKTASGIRGRFAKRLRKLNTTYNQKKTELFQRPSNLHICCGCDASPNEQHKRVIDVAALSPKETRETLTGKTLLIFTCAGGQGHLSVASALSAYALVNYHIEVANTLEDTLASTDLFKRLLFNFSHERLYNYLLRKEEFEWLKVITSVGLFFFLMQQESIEREIRLEILRRSPDMLISCFPCLNPMFLNIAKELDLPLLMVTTDIDTNLYTKGMNSQTSDLSYPKWRMTLAYDTPETRAIIEKRIPKDKIHVSGFPVRPSFRKKAPDTTCQSLRRQFGIQKGDRVILVMIGGVASQTTEKYAHLLAHLSEREVDSLTSGNLHVICLCGNQKFSSNLEMRLKIDTLMPLTNRVRIHGTGAMRDVAPLFDIADCLITKPGGSSTSEALHKQVPMILHAPFALMDWEVSNMEFCIQAQMGLRFRFQGSNLEKNQERLLPLIREAFFKRDTPPKYTFEMKDFGEEFLSEVETLLN